MNQVFSAELVAEMMNVEREFDEAFEVDQETWNPWDTYDRANADPDAMRYEEILERDFG